MVSGRSEPAIDRFWSYVMPEPNSGCWLWTGGLGGSGYAHFHPRGGEDVRAHRWAYEQFKGPVSTGLDLDHKCRIRFCVNPDHLEPVTRSVNLSRGEVGRRKQPLCKRGHRLEGDNIYIDPKRGKRSCATCRRARRKETYDATGK